MIIFYRGEYLGILQNCPWRLFHYLGEQEEYFLDRSYRQCDWILFILIFHKINQPSMLI